MTIAVVFLLGVILGSLAMYGPARKKGQMEAKGKW